MRINSTAGILRLGPLLHRCVPALHSGKATLGALLWLQFPGGKGQLYNVLWAVVFGFATLNILSLGAKRFEPNKTHMDFGEVMAVLVVVVSVIILGWEMLQVFKIFPIKLNPR